MDIVNSQRVLYEDDLQEDYELNSPFPPKAPYHLRNLIEFRLTWGITSGPQPYERMPYWLLFC